MTEPDEMVIPLPKQFRMPVKGECRVTTARDPLTGVTSVTWEFVPPDCDYVEIRRDMLDHLLRTHNWEADQ